jgi:hypothetical protein
MMPIAPAAVQSSIVKERIGDLLCGVVIADRGSKTDVAYFVK